MKKFALVLLCFAMVGSAQERQTTRSYTPSGQGAVASSRSATAFSMMSWGVGLAVGIATLCALMDTSSTSHSH